MTLYDIHKILYHFIENEDAMVRIHTEMHVIEINNKETWAIDLYRSSIQFLFHNGSLETKSPEECSEYEINMPPVIKHDFISAIFDMENRRYNMFI